MTGLPISTFVRLQTEIAAGGVLRTEYGTGLLVTTEDGIAAGGPGKVKGYADIEAVQADWASGQALAAARVWFGGEVEPHALFIGRWATADVSTTLEGTQPTAAAGAAPLNAADASLAINGTNVTGINLSSAGTYAAIAAALQTAIRAAVSALSAATVEYVSTLNGGSGGFRITVPVAAGAAVAITGGVLGTARNAMGTAVGTDISAALGLASGTDYRLGHAAETLAQALAEMVPLATGGAPTLPMVDGSCPNELSGVNTREALATFVQAGDYFAFIRDNGEDALVSGGTGTFRRYVFDNQLSKVEAVVGAGDNFGDDTNYIDVAANAFLSSQRFNLPASIRNPHLKSMPGATPINIDGDQLADLVSTRTSVYTRVGGLPSLAGGYTGKAGVWADAQYWVGWLKNELELNIFNAQRASAFFSTAELIDTLEQVRNTATQSGGLQPGGRVNSSVRQQIRQTFNEPTFDGILPTGWRQWVEQPSARSDLDRENRRGRLRIFIAGADAINEVTGSIVFSS